MVALPDRHDPTLAAIDREIERRAAEQPRRSYLGASQIGEPCERKLWYAIQPGVPREDWNAASLKRFEDGHRSEDVMAHRLRLVSGVELHTVDETGEQFGFSDFGGAFKGHVDGLVRGLLQAPETPHVWEHKAVNEKKFAEFQKIKGAVGEKATLAEWDAVYYAQAVVYMHYFDMKRHYLTVTTPGAREHASCRTEANPQMAMALRAKARRVIEATEPPARLSERPEFWKCKMCEFRAVCHAV
jgi:CRISPR/Cas system-associated exonuclease Cas4 (RecB family)